MLVLSRKKNESIVVDESIVITVVEIRGDKVRLGIEAPREVPIHRSEVYEAIQAMSGHVPAASDAPVVSPMDAGVATDPARATDATETNPAAVD
jgi:carbon storage regulator